jgi:hypothetical protein
MRWLALVLVGGCAAQIAEPGVYIAGDLSFTGTSGIEQLACDAGVVVDHGCVVNGGMLAGERVTGGSYECFGGCEDPAKGATIVAWAECR